MENKSCKDCDFFIQHYVKMLNQYVEAGCGHCIALRVKRCAPENTVCEHFLQITSEKA